MKNPILTIILIVVTLTKINSQGIIINEISNGTSGTKEFIEFLVVGSDVQPNGLVSLRNWVFDDNNGDFEASTGTGVAAGHYRFTALLPPIPIGSLIVVYNSSDINLNIPPDDPLDTNLDGVYIIPVNSIYLERCTSIPSSILGPSYLPCVYTSTTSQTWNNIGLRNGGDATQTRAPNFSFYHGFSYGDVLTPVPVFPPEFGSKNAFNVLTGDGRHHNYFLDCSDWTEQSSYMRGDANFDTPGLPNTSNNGNLIYNIKIGYFDYKYFLNPVNCFPIILTENSIRFEAEKQNKYILISWDTMDLIDTYELQKSEDGYSFNKISISEINETYLDVYPTLNNYYRLKLTDFKGDIINTHVIYVEGDIVETITIYPNPTNDRLYISSNSDLDITNIEIYNSTGKLVVRQEYKTIYVKNLNNGLYIFKIYHNMGVSTNKFLKF
tara:strand:- start:1281 stop:2594 length:1314 start_codon:yes stop_codon:yes gene_type:complete